MKIFKPTGSKERFAEIFQGVTKIKLNEGFGQSYNPQAVLEMAFEGLKNYLNLRGFNIGKIIEYAKICRVETIIMPYLKAIVA